MTIVNITMSMSMTETDWKHCIFGPSVIFWSSVFYLFGPLDLIKSTSWDRKLTVFHEVTLEIEEVHRRIPLYLLPFFTKTTINKKTKIA